MLQIDLENPNIVQNGHFDKFVKSNENCNTQIVLRGLCVMDFET